MPVKLYTRAGDKGDTGLIGGRRVPKEDLRVEAYGAIDELCCQLGLAQVDLPAEVGPVAEVLLRLQHELFILGAELATPPNHDVPKHRLEERHVRRLEQEIDLFSEPLEGINAFVLPRGTVAACRLHLARAVARRAERAVVRLHRAQPLRPPVLEYVNRLSGLLFALALSVNQKAGVGELPPDYSR